MELYIINVPTTQHVVLLDDKMQLIKPVCDFLKFQQQKGRAFNSLKAYGRDLLTFWRFLDEIDGDYTDVTPSLITDFIDYLRCDNISSISLYNESIRTNQTINRILSTVHSFYQFLSNIKGFNNPILIRDISSSNNMFRSLLHHARTDNRTKQSIFKLKESRHIVKLVTDKEFELFLGALTKRRDILLYKLLYHTGARIQEVLDLEIESVPVPDMTQAVGVFKQIKSKGKYRNLYVPMFLIAELDDFIMNERSRFDTAHSYIFVSEQAKQLGKQLTYSAAYNKLKKIQAKIGLDFNFHDLRHTFCSNLIQSGMDASIAQLIMGHEHISTTQKYTHLSDPFIRESLSQYWEKGFAVGGVSDEG